MALRHFVRLSAHIIGLLAALFSASAAAQPIQGIPELAGWDQTVITAMSADGNVIVGYVENFTINGIYATQDASRAFRWEDGTITLLSLLPGHTFSEAEGVSADGSVVAGWSCAKDELLRVDCRALTWSGTQPVILPFDDPDAEYLSSRAYAVSASGAVIVGESTISSSTPMVRWAGGAAPVPIEGLYNAWAHAVSDDGSVIAASSSVPNRGNLFGDAAQDLYRITGQQVTPLSLLPGAVGGAIYDASGDGSIFVGSVRDAGNINRPVIWGPSGLEQLPIPDNAVYGGVATAVSQDGTVVVGFYTMDDFDDRVAIWRSGEFSDLLDELVSAGIEPDDVYLGTPSGISSDGTVIAGRFLTLDDEYFPFFRVQLGLVVNHTGDESDPDPGDGVCDFDPQTAGPQCTLRAAIETVNAGEAERISFAIPETDSGCDMMHCTISPQSPLPVISMPVTVNGSTQPEADIVIDGSAAGPAAAGLKIQAEGVVLKGLSIGRFGRYGIEVFGGSDHTIVASRIGVLEDGLANGLGGILVSGAAKDVTIGGLDEEDENVVAGGIRIDGSGTSGISILRNTIQLPVEATINRPLRIPIDLAGDGPTCTAWDSDLASQPNHAVAPPRVLDLTATSVSGVARAGATVVAYEVDETGSFSGRYWARSVSPIGTGEAGAGGQFTVEFDEALGAGSQIVLSMVDADGNTSELTQLRRPIIFIPGVGGSWLEAAGGDNLFLPTGLTDSELNARLGRLAMDPTGMASANGEVVRVDGILEQVGLPYRPVLQHLQDAGFPGDPENDREANIDLWRFPYDWRRDPTLVADQLKWLIDGITWNAASGESAVSCQVDILTHSNGGMVGSSYVWKAREHSRDRVNRILMSAAPYLGTPQVVAAHTAGYLFDIEKSIPGTDLDWAILLQTFQNLPDGYGLLPSRAFWEASNGLRFHGLLPDLRGRKLKSYDDAFSFMTRAKLFGDGSNRGGLARNAQMWSAQQSRMHDIMNDWRAYDGPPQIFRHVGRLPASTTEGWYLASGFADIDVEESTRREVGDTDRHVAYRESIMPLFAMGDGTVALLSATLGGGLDLQGNPEGVVDFSGQDRLWIEPFEYYPCKHIPIVAGGCSNENGSSLGRIVSIFRSSYRVEQEAAGKGNPALADPIGEVLYVEASSPVRVIVTDASGARTGPVSGESGAAVEYGVPELGYWSNARNAAISINSDENYTVAIEASAATTVRLRRGQSGAGGMTNALFEDVEVEASGRLEFAYTSGGTPIDRAFDVDTDGDGTMDLTLGPAAELASQGSAAGAVVPRPDPGIVTVQINSGSSNPVEMIELEDPSGAAWTWTVESIPDWIEPGAVSGQMPGALELTLDAAARGVGLHRDTLALRLSYADYSTTLRIPVELAVRAEAAETATIVVYPTNPQLAPGDSLQFWAVGFDQLGLPIDVPVEWSATGGSISSAGWYVAGFSQGDFAVTASDAGSVVSGERGVRVGVVTAVENSSELPDHVVLEGNYPNPFNPRTRIRYALPVAAPVRLEVFDVFGRRVTTLVDAYHQAGRYEAVFDASVLASGMYVYRLVSGGIVRSGRMVRVK